MYYDWNFGRLVPYIHAFLSGVVTTIELTVIVILAGTLLGASLGLLLTRRLPRVVLLVAIDVVRAIPPLVLILFAYFFLTPQVIGLVVPAFWAAALAMSLNLAVFTADVVRAAIEGVPKGEVESAIVLGMSQGQIRRYIVLPHVARQSLPAMLILYIGMLKMTSLASVINVREVVYAAQTVVADVSRSLEAWVIVAAVYVVMVVPASRGARRVERWLERGRPGR